MAKIELEGMQELIDKVNKLGTKGEIIKKKTLHKAGDLVKNSMEKKAPRSSLSKKHMADHIKISEIEKENGVDSVEDVITAFEGVDVEIELNQLSLESRAKHQGAKVVKGVLIENKDDTAPTIALGFRSKKNNGKYRYVWLLKGKFELATDEYDTEAEKPKTQSAKLKGKFYPREADGNYRLIADEDMKDVDATIISGWFTAVPSEPGKTQS